MVGGALAIMKIASHGAVAEGREGSAVELGPHADLGGHRDEHLLLEPLVAQIQLAQPGLPKTELLTLKYVYTMIRYNRARQF